MSSEWTSAAVTLGMLAAPTAVRVAEAGDVSVADEARERCVIQDRAPVERRLGGEKDIATRLARGTRVTVTDEREDSSHIRYPWKSSSRVGWVETEALGACAEDQPAPHRATPTPAPAETSSGGAGSFHPFGLPVGTVLGGRVLSKAAYDCYHDPALRYCRWVGYCYQPTGRTSPRYSGDFFAEPSLSADVRADPADYKGAYKRDLTGFDRGHMAPDATIKAFGTDPQKETYSLANITPQFSRMNQGIWRELEDQIRDWASPGERVCVETGPVFEKDRTVERLKVGNKLAIPHAYFAIITRGTDPEVLSFVVANEPVVRDFADIREDAESVDAIEAATGFDFLPDLADALEDTLEVAVAEELWQ